MRDVIFLAISGAFGTVSRYFFNQLSNNMFGDSYPYGTFIVNLLGCLILGTILGVSVSTDMINDSTRQIIMVGFLGAFTTFSAFGYDTMRFIESGDFHIAGINVLANVIFGIIAIWAGTIMGKLIFN